YIELRARSAQLAQDAAQADRALRPVEKSLTDAEKAAEGLDKGLSDLGQTAKTTATTLGSVDGAARKATTSITEARKATGEAGQAATKATGSFLSFKNVFGLGVGAAIIGVGKAAVDAANALERAV